MVQTRRSARLQKQEETTKKSSKKSKSSTKSKGGRRGRNGKTNQSEPSETPAVEVATFRKILHDSVNNRIHCASKLREFLSSARCKNGPILLKLRGCVVDIRTQLTRTCQVAQLPCFFVGGHKEEILELVCKLEKITAIDEAGVNKTQEADLYQPRCLIHVVRGASKKFLVALLEELLESQFPAVVSVYCNESNLLSLPPSLSCRLKSKSLTFQEVVPMFGDVLFDLIRHYGEQKRRAFAPGLLKLVSHRFIRQQMSFVDAENLLARVIAEFQLDEPKWKNAIVNLPVDFDFSSYLDALTVFARFLGFAASEDERPLMNPLVDSYIQQQSEDRCKKRFERAKKYWTKQPKAYWVGFLKRLEGDSTISEDSRVVLSEMREEVENVEVADVNELIRKQMNSKISQRRRLPQSDQKWAKQMIDKMESFLEQRMTLQFDFEEPNSSTLQTTVDLDAKADDVDEIVQLLIGQGAIV